MAPRRDKKGRTGEPASAAAVAPAGLEADVWAQGRSAHRAGRLDEAERLYRALLDRRPGHAGALRNLAAVLTRRGRAAEALPLAERAVEVSGGAPHACYIRGRVRMVLGQFPAAAEDFRRAAGQLPKLAEAWQGLGETCRHLGRLEEAEAALRRAVDLRPDYRDALWHLMATLGAQSRHGEAEGVARRLLERYPQWGQLWADLGVLLRKQGRLEESLEAARRGEELAPRDPSVLYRLAGSLMQLRRLDEAEAVIDRALEAQPDHAPSRFCRSTFLLRRQEMPEGWREYRWRWRSQHFTCRDIQRRFSQPPWAGEDIAGRTILLHPEQGMGDVLQFVRFAPAVRRRAGRLVLEVQPPLLRLLRGVAGADVVTPVGPPPPPYDVHCPLLDVPAALDATPADIPADVPYVSPDAADVRTWGERLRPERRLRVGLVWAGNPKHSDDRQRSMSADRLGPLLATEGAAFYSLQLDRSEETAALAAAAGAAGGLAGDLAPHMKDFADTAAVMENLDLVISVDTAAAHLAGALARPVWLLMPPTGDWRWLCDREDSPWYPTMRIFRQRTLGDWDELIERVAAELRRQAERHGRDAGAGCLPGRHG